MLDLQVGSEQRAVVIVLNQTLIARDIQMTVQGVRPEAMVIVVRTFDELISALTPTVVIDLAFVDDVAVAKALVEASNLVNHACSKVVLVGQEPDALPPRPNWTVLPYPFTNQDVETLL